MARILVIDDDAMVRALLRTVLEAEGHEVMDAADGNAGLLLCRSQEPHLVITDILMPEADGSWAIRRFKRDFPEITIFAMSGGGQIASSETCLNVAQRVGAARVFEKPISHDELLQAIRDLVG